MRMRLDQARSTGSTVVTRLLAVTVAWLSYLVWQPGHISMPLFLAGIPVPDLVNTIGDFSLIPVSLAMPEHLEIRMGATKASLPPENMRWYKGSTGLQRDQNGICFSLPAFPVMHHPKRGATLHTDTDGSLELIDGGGCSVAEVRRKA